MAKARVNGIEIDYQDTGRGRPILLTHGHMSGRTAWDGQHAALGDRYRVISWDVRGHGQTEVPDDPAQYSLELTVADIQAPAQPPRDRARRHRRPLARRLRLARLLPRASREVEALVICDSGRASQTRRPAAVERAGRSPRADELEARALESLAGRSREVQETRSRHRSARSLAHATRGILAQQGSTVIDGLPSIDVPTLVIVGDQDTAFLAPCEYMAKKIPGARLETIVGAGHSSNLDRPDAFNRVLLEFLESLRPARSGGIDRDEAAGDNAPAYEEGIDARHNGRWRHCFLRSPSRSAGRSIAGLRDGRDVRVTGRPTATMPAARATAADPDRSGETVGRFASRGRNRRARTPATAGRAGGSPSRPRPSSSTGRSTSAPRSAG